MDLVEDKHEIAGQQNLEKKQGRVRTKYQRISNQQRTEIVNLFTQGKTYSQLTEITGVNVSTVKAIIRVYLNEKRLNKQVRKKAICQKQTNFFVYLYEEKTYGLEIVKHVKWKQNELIRENDADQIQQEQKGLQMVEKLLAEQHEYILSTLDGDQSKTNYIEQLDKQRMECIQFIQNNQASRGPKLNFIKWLITKPEGEELYVQIENLKNVFENQLKEIYTSLL